MVVDPTNIHVEMRLIVSKLSLVPDVYVRIARALAKLRLSWLCLFAYVNVLIIFFWLEDKYIYIYIYDIYIYIYIYI